MSTKTCPEPGRRTNRTSFCHGVIVGAVALGLSFSGAPEARADGAVSCAVLEIEASTSAAPAIDGGLKALERKLRKPPFSSWNTFKQLGSSSLSLEAMKPGSLGLVHGHATLLLRDSAAAGGKKARLSLGIALDDQDGKRVLDSKVNVDAGDYIVVGRSLPANKGHLVAVSCKL